MQWSQLDNPYLIRLTGEYVIEILQVIKDNLGNIDKGITKDFIAENARFYNTIKSRVVSYWDCYYRIKHPTKTNYVGFEIIEYFSLWIFYIELKFWGVQKNFLDFP